MYDDYKSEDENDYISDEEKKEKLEKDMEELGLSEQEKEEVRKGHYKIDSPDEKKVSDSVE